jgi:hypothetical protein
MVMIRARSAARWRLRRAFWNAVAIFKYRFAKAGVIGTPRRGRRISTVPLVTKYTGIEIAAIRVADRVPRDEAYIYKRVFGRAQAALYRIFSPMQPGLAPITNDSKVALLEAYTPAHRRHFPEPVTPPEFEGGADLGAVAIASPYACYLQADPSGRLRWDFSALDGFERHHDLRSRPAASILRSIKTGDCGRFASIATPVNSNRTSTTILSETLVKFGLSKRAGPAVPTFAWISQ